MAQSSYEAPRKFDRYSIRCQRKPDITERCVLCITLEIKLVVLLDFSEFEGFWR